MDMNVKAFRDYAPASATDFGLVGSKADFTAVSRPLQIVGKSGSVLPVDSHKAIVRMIDGAPAQIGIVGTDYKLVQHRDFFAAIEEAITSNIRPDLQRDPLVKTQTAYDGAYVRREYVFPAFRDALKGSETLKASLGFRVIAWNSLDGSTAAGMLSGLIDFWCANGMISGSLIGKQLRRHTSGFDMEAFRHQIAVGVGQAQGEVRFLERVASSKLDMDKAETVLKAHFSDRMAQRLLEQTQREVRARGQNAFALLSALTYFASHDDEQAGFGLRDTGADHGAKTLQSREIEVQNLIRGAGFASLLEARAA